MGCPTGCPLAHVAHHIPIIRSSRAHVINATIVRDMCTPSFCLYTLSIYIYTFCPVVVKATPPAALQTKTPFLWYIIRATNTALWPKHLTFATDVWCGVLLGHLSPGSRNNVSA